MQPGLIRKWVNLGLAQAERAFDRPTGKLRQAEAEAQNVARLEAKLANKNEVIAELMQGHVQLKKTWGPLKEQWVPQDTRDEVVDYVKRRTERTELPKTRLIGRLGVGASKF